MRGIFSACLSLCFMVGSCYAQSVMVSTPRGEVSVTTPVERIVAFPAGVIDTLDALGVSLSGMPSDVHLDYIKQNDAVAIGTLFSADVEAIHRLSPDLVIVGTRSAAQYDSVSNVAPTIDLSLASGNHYQAAIARMHQLAALTHTTEKAAQWEQKLTQLTDRVKSLIDPKEQVMVVMLMGRSLHMLTSKTRIDWFQSELGMTLIGDPSKQLGELAPISYEYIVAKDPDWLIVFDRDAAVGIKASSQAQQQMDNALIKMTNASQQEQILYLDGVGTLNAVGGVQGIQHTLEQLERGFSHRRVSQ